MGSRISYCLPPLLKSLYDIKIPESSFASFIEAGAYKLEIRRLREINIPIETATYLNRIFPFTYNGTKNDLVNQVKRIKHQRNQWHQKQIDIL